MRTLEGYLTDRETTGFYEHRAVVERGPGGELLIRFTQEGPYSEPAVFEVRGDYTLPVKEG